MFKSQYQFMSKAEKNGQILRFRISDALLLYTKFETNEHRLASKVFLMDRCPCSQTSRELGNNQSEVFINSCVILDN